MTVTHHGAVSTSVPSASATDGRIDWRYRPKVAQKIAMEKARNQPVSTCERTVADEKRSARGR